MRKHVAVTVLALGSIITIGSTLGAADSPEIPASAFDSAIPAEYAEPTPPGMEVPLPYCADGVTISTTGLCEPLKVEVTPTAEAAPVPTATATPEPAALPDNCPGGFIRGEDGFCLEAAPADVIADVPDVVPPADAAYVELDPLEDEPGWDCRTMGNRICGVFIVDQWYAVEFAGGQPVYVAPRGF